MPSLSAKVQKKMSEQEHEDTKEEQKQEQEQQWQELMLPHLLYTETVQQLHATILNEWDPLRKSACQTAAGRALWKHIIHDPFADLLAGETQLRSLHQKIKNDKLNNAREISGVLLAVRTLWFDSKVEAALASFRDEPQVVLLGAGQFSLVMLYCSYNLKMAKLKTERSCIFLIFVL